MTPQDKEWLEGILEELRIDEGLVADAAYEMRGRVQDDLLEAQAAMNKAIEHVEDALPNY